MLLIILALFWVAILAPVVVRRFRDSGTERSITSFHAEHEVPADHHLLDVDHAQLVRGEHGEQP